MSLKPLCVLLREADNRGDYAAAVSATGACAAHVRVLTFAPENVMALEAVVRSGGAGYGGLLLSSPQGASQLLRACVAVGGAPASLVALPAWTVGAQTAGLLSSAGLCAASAASAEELLPLISPFARKGASLPLLYLTGSKRLETLPAGLRALGIAFEELLVYRTAALSPGEVDTGLAAALRCSGGLCEHRRVVLVVFSPSGLDALSGELATSLLRRAAGDVSAAATDGCIGDDLGLARVAVRLIAFGTTTASALVARGLPIAAKTRSPDAAGVAAALAEISWD